MTVWHVYTCVVRRQHKNVIRVDKTQFECSKNVIKREVSFVDTRTEKCHMVMHLKTLSVGVDIAGPDLWSLHKHS